MSGEVSFTPTAADAVAVSRGSFTRGLKRRRFHVRLIAIAALGAAGGAAFGWLTDGTVTVRDVATGLAASFGWIGVLLGLLYLLIPRRSRRLFRQQRSLNRAFTFAWTDKGIVFASDNSRSDVDWSEYHDWFETAAVFGFGLNERLYHWVPKRALSGDQMADLRGTAARSLAV